MITCLGLMVGVLESAERQDVLNKCARFLKNHKYLIGGMIDFKIDGKTYVSVLDICDENERFWVLFETYDGRTCAGIA